MFGYTYGPMVSQCELRILMHHSRNLHAANATFLLSSSRLPIVEESQHLAVPYPQMSCHNGTTSSPTPLPWVRHL